jgi:hypothetical protein
VAVGVVGVLALTSGCGGGDGAGTDGRTRATAPGRSAPATHAAPAATSGAPAAADRKVLGQKELDRLALNDQDVPGYTADAVTGKGHPLHPEVLTTYRAVTPAACRPLYAAAEMGSLHSPSAEVDQDVVSRSDELADHASVGLSSYTPADARGVMAELRAAFRSCGTATIRPPAAHAGSGLSYSRPQPRPAPHLGDDTLAFDLGQVVGGMGTIRMTVLVTRVGSTVVTFLSINPFQPPAVPPEIVTAQMKKLA